MRARLRSLRSRFLAPVRDDLSATNARLGESERDRANIVAGFEARIGGIEAAISRIEHGLDERAAREAIAFDSRISGIEEAVSRIEHRIDQRQDVSDHRAEGLLQHSVAAAADTGRALDRLERDLLLSRETVLELAAHVARELGDLRDTSEAG